jgi:hypothetical protein
MQSIPSVIGTSLLELTPQPPIDFENTILSGFIAAQATNFKNVSQATLSKLLDLYAHPTDDLSNSTLFDRATQFETDYSFLGPQRLFLKTASAEERKQDVWAYSFQQHLPGSPDFFGGEEPPSKFSPFVSGVDFLLRTAFHTSDLYYLDMGFPIGPAQKLKSQIQDIYISFVNDLSPGIFWPKYAEESKIVMRLQDGSLSPIVDTVRRNLTDFLNQVDVMEEFGRFG